MWKVRKAGGPASSYIGLARPDALLNFLSLSSFSLLFTVQDTAALRKGRVNIVGFHNVKPYLTLKLEAEQPSKTP
jgi:hypothetical protein